MCGGGKSAHRRETFTSWRDRPSVIAGGGGQPADGVRQRTRITSDVTVGFADLDLRSDYGRWMLAQRLRIAADEACDRIDEIDLPSAVGVVHDDCRSLAMRRAEPQMRRAISAAG
jgi:UrcA family protein